MIEEQGAGCQRHEALWRNINPDNDILQMRIGFFIALGVMAIAVVLYGTARHDSQSVVGNADSVSHVGLSEGARRDSIKTLRAAVRKRIADSDTYLGHALVEDDSVLRRWQDRTIRMLTVHIGSNTTGGISGELESSVLRAFSRWERVGAIPVTFRTVRDSANAEVHVHWIHSFPVNRSGQAQVFWDSDGWIRKAILTLATHDPYGRPVNPDVLYTVSLHEIGHLLGLGHSDDPSDLMYAITTAHDLTARDRRSARLLYALPAGSIRDPRDY